MQCVTASDAEISRVFISPCCDVSVHHAGIVSNLLLAGLMGQYCFARWRLSLSSVTLPAGAWVVGRLTLHGGPVRLRPVRATPYSVCLIMMVRHSAIWRHAVWCECRLTACLLLQVVSV